MCMATGWRTPVLPDRGVTQETTADLESHSQFDPTQKHFHASNCLREKAYVRPVICAWLKNSPAILTISFWLPLRAAQESNRLLQGKLWEESCDGHKHIGTKPGFLSFSFKCSCCNTKDNYNSCIITNAKRWKLATSAGLKGSYFTLMYHILSFRPTQNCQCDPQRTLEKK